MKINNPKRDLEIVSLDEKGLSFTSDHKKEELTIYDKELIENMIEQFFNKKFHELAYLVAMYNNSDDEDGESLVLEKMSEFREFFLMKYEKLLSKNKLAKYLNMLDMLESNINLSYHKGR